MDHQMPGLDRLMTLSLLRQYERTASVPVLMVTSTHEREVVTKAHSLGAVAFVQKPFDAAVLRAQVIALLTLGQRHERQRKLLEEEHVKQRELERQRAAGEAAAAALRARTEFLGM